MSFTLLFYSILCRLLPNKLIAMSIVYHSEKDMNRTVEALFDDLSK